MLGSECRLLVEELSRAEAQRCHGVSSWWTVELCSEEAVVKKAGESFNWVVGTQQGMRVKGR